MPHQFFGPASQAETRLFLSVDTPEQTKMTYDLWDGFSGIPGLLSAIPERSGRHAGKYYYDAARRVYIDTASGRDVTQDRLVRAVRKISYETSTRIKKSTQQLIAGVIILTVWYARMRDLMRALYKTIWILSIGGFVFDDDTARNLFYLLVLLHFNYLDNFVEQLYTGEQAIDGRAMARAGLYGSYGNGLWQNIELDRAEELGRTEAKRILGTNEEHCTDDEDRPGCIELAALGWIPVRDMVPIGDAVCYSNCHCRITYR